jgi:hypothetical protein
MELVEIRYVIKNGRKNAHSYCDKCLLWISCRAFNRHRVKCSIKNNAKNPLQERVQVNPPSSGTAYQDADTPGTSKTDNRGSK